MKNILLQALILTTMASPALACDCGSLTNKQKYEHSSSVFTGTVKEIDESGITINVTSYYKGVLHPTFHVDRQNDDCDYDFKKNDTYLVYAHPWKGKVLVNQCLGTSPIGDAAENLRWLKKHSKYHSVVK